MSKDTFTVALHIERVQIDADESMGGIIQVRIDASTAAPPGATAHDERWLGERLTDIARLMGCNVLVTFADRQYRGAK